MLLSYSVAQFPVDFGLSLLLTKQATDLAGLAYYRAPQKELQALVGIPSHLYPVSNLADVG